MFKKILSLLTLVLISISLLAQETKTRSIGRQYSKKLIEQEKYFDELKKSDGKNYGNKELAVEYNVTANTDVYIDNNSRTIEIKTWDEPKVKLVTKVFFDGAATSVNTAAWLEKLKIYTTQFGNSLRIRTDYLSYGVNNNNASGVEIYSVDGQYLKTEANKNKIITIYIPKQNKLHVETKYANLAISSYIKNATIDVISGNLEINNVSLLNLRSKYSNVSIDEVQNGEIDFINGNLEVGILGDVEVETKYSNVEVGVANKLILNSTNDEYSIDEVNVFEATKEYGSCRINKLTEQLQFEGINADCRVKQITATVKSINIDNKYATIKIPLKLVDSFIFNYDGPYSSILKSNNWGNDGNDDNKISTGDVSNSKYKHIVNNGLTKINVKCQNCTVDCR
jgi:hypothetical protein